VGVERLLGLAQRRRRVGLGAQRGQEGLEPLGRSRGQSVALGQARKRFP
jgi:hypothetical protein